MMRLNIGSRLRVTEIAWRGGRGVPPRAELRVTGVDGAGVAGEKNDLIDIGRSSRELEPIQPP